MEKNRFDILIEKAKTESLSAEEKAGMLAHVSAFMRENPVQRVRSPYGGWMLLYKHHAMSVAFAVVLFFGAGGTAFAEQALPGDWLYRVKVGVNEQIRGWFAQSPEAEAEWQLSLAERRFKEIEELDNAKRLSPELNSKLQSNIELYTSRALGDQMSDFSRASQGDSVSAELSQEVPVALMAKSAVSDSNSASASFFQETWFSLETISDLKKQVDEGKRLVKTKTSELRAQHILIRTKAGLLIADQSLFEAKRAYLQGDVSRAEDLTNDARSALSSIGLDGFLESTSSKKDAKVEGSDAEFSEEGGASMDSVSSVKDDGTEATEEENRVSEEGAQGELEPSGDLEIISDVNISLPLFR